MPGSDYLAHNTWKPFTIADGASSSGAIDTLGWDVVGIEQPADCEGVRFIFQGSYNGVDFVDIYDQTGTRISVTKSATLAQILSLAEGTVNRLRGFAQIKVVTADGSLAVVTQTTAASLKVALSHPE